MRPLIEPAYGRHGNLLQRLFGVSCAPGAPQASPEGPALAQPSDSVVLGASSVERRLDPALAALGARPLDPPATSTEVLGLHARPLRRPVVLVQGIGQQADCWYNMKQFLCGGGANCFGGVYRADDESAFLAQVRRTPGANVFAIDFTRNLASPVQQANELASLIDRVKALSGASAVDLVTHSMGGIVAREYLHRAPHNVSSLVMIAPPNHGSAIADLGLAASGLGVYEHYPADQQEALFALRTQESLTGDERNPYLGALERSWSTDSAGVRTTIIAGGGFPTPALDWTPVVSGDGFVTPHSAHLEGADFYVATPASTVAGQAGFRDFEATRYNHLHLMSEFSVFQKVDEALAADVRQPAPSGPVQLELFDAAAPVATTPAP